MVRETGPRHWEEDGKPFVLDENGEWIPVEIE